MRSLSRIWRCSSDGSWTGRCAIRICVSMKPETSAEARKSSTRYLGDDRVHEHRAPQSGSQARLAGLVLCGDAQRRPCCAAPMAAAWTQPLPHHGDYRRSSCTKGRHLRPVSDCSKMIFNAPIILSYLRIFPKQRLNAFRRRLEALPI